MFTVVDYARTQPHGFSNWIRRVWSRFSTLGLIQSPDQHQLRPFHVHTTVARFTQVVCGYRETYRKQYARPPATRLWTPVVIRPFLAVFMSFLSPKSGATVRLPFLNCTTSSSSSSSSPHYVQSPPPKNNTSCRPIRRICIAVLNIPQMSPRTTAVHT